MPEPDTIDSIDSVDAPDRPWTIFSSLGYSALLLFTFIAVQSVIAVGYLAVQIVQNGEDSVAHFADQIEFDGHFLTLATFGTALLCVPLVFYVTRKRERDPRAFLRIIGVDRGTLFRCTLLILAGIAATDLVTVALGRPIVPEFMIQTRANSNPVLFLGALVIAAPIFEEIFFRGFMIGSLEASGASAVVSGLVSSVAWAGIHLQYDLFGITTVFLMGLLFATVRSRTGSIVPGIWMHALANLVAFIEVDLFG